MSELVEDTSVDIATKRSCVVKVIKNWSIGCRLGHDAVLGHAWSMLGCARITRNEIHRCRSEQLL